MAKKRADGGLYFYLARFTCLYFCLFVYFYKLVQVEVGGRKFSKKHAAALGQIVLIGPVINLLALSTAGHQVGLFKKVEMMRDGRLRDVKKINQITNASFALVL